MSNTTVSAAILDALTSGGAPTAAGGEDDDLISLSVTQLSLRVFYVAVAVLGLLGNTFVAAVMLGVDKLRKKLTVVYIVNQSILDGITALFLLLTTLVEYKGHPLVGISGELYCYFWMGKLPLWSCMFSSTYNLVVLTLERYSEVVHAIKHRNTFTRTKAMMSLGGIWLVGPVFYLSYALPTSAVVNGSCQLLVIWPDTTTQQAVGVLAVILQYFLPVTIIGYCYGAMAYVLTKRMKGVQPQSANPQPGQVSNQQGGPGHAGTKSSHLSRGKRAIIQTLAIVSTAFILCTSWNQWFFLLFNIGVLDYRAFSSTFYHFSVAMQFANCCVNPFIYVFKYQQFQTELKRIFYRKIGSKESSGPGQTLNVAQNTVSTQVNSRSEEQSI